MCSSNDGIYLLIENHQSSNTVDIRCSLFYFVYLFFCILACYSSTIFEFFFLVTCHLSFFIFVFSLDTGFCFFSQNIVNFVWIYAKQNIRVLNIWRHSQVVWRLFQNEVVIRVIFKDPSSATASFHVCLSIWQIVRISKIEFHMCAGAEHKGLQMSENLYLVYIVLRLMTLLS